MTDPRLPMDAPELREQKQSDYCLDMCIERGPHVSVRLPRIVARATLAQITKVMEGNGETTVVRIEHDGGETVVNAEAILVASIRPWVEPQGYAELGQGQQSAEIVGRIGPRRPH